MTESRRRNPMQAAAFDLTGVDVCVQVNTMGAVALKLNDVNIELHEIMNELETTDFVDVENLPTDIKERKAIYAGLLARLERANGKYYIVIDAAYSAELMAYINLSCSSYTDNLVKNTNLLYADIDKLPEYKLASQYKMDGLHNPDASNFLERCAAIATFQKERLIAMRPSLNNAEARKKMDGRYSADALFQKACSKKIFVFSAMKEDSIIATLVINMHTGQGKSLLDSVGYVSDILIDEDHIKDTYFLQQFMTSAFRQFADAMPQVKTLTLMAPGDSKDPLVQCIADVGLFSKLDKSEQIKRGLIAFFVQSPDNTPKLNKTDTPATLFYREKPATGEVKSDASDAKRVRRVDGSRG